MARFCPASLCCVVVALWLGVAGSAGFVGPAAAEMVLRRGNMAEPDTLDPDRSGNDWEKNIINDLMMGLTTEDIDGKPIPGAAESWSVSADGLVWTFHLRPGLVWSDGVPLTASDFVFGFRRVMDPKTAARYASVEYVIKNAAAVNAGKLPLETLGVRAPDDRTVEITLETPTPFLPGLMTHDTAFPIPEHVLRKYGEAWTHPGNLVSDGPFTLALWRPHDQIEIVKNPLFYDAKNVRLDAVYFYPIDDETAALSRYRAREIDANIGPRGFPIAELPWLKENMPGEAHLQSGLQNLYIVFNTRRTPFNDARARRAVSLCVDRELMAQKVARDGRVPAYAFVPPGIANYHANARLDFSGWSMDARRAQAQALLSAAGYSASHPLTFEYMHMNSIEARRDAIAVITLLKQCGIIAHPIAHEPKVHYSMMESADFTAATGAWIADYDDPQNFLYLLDSRSGVFNFGGYANPAFDALMDDAKTTLDLDRRADLLSRAEQIALNDSAVAPLSFPTDHELVAPYVRGYRENVVDVHRSRWMWLDR